MGKPVLKFIIYSIATCFLSLLLAYITLYNKLLIINDLSLCLKILLLKIILKIIFIFKRIYFIFIY